MSHQPIVALARVVRILCARLDPRTYPVVIFAPLFLAALVLSGCDTGKSAFDLEVGDCIAPPDEGSEVERVKTVDCTQPHDGEVVAVFDLEVDQDEYPGEDALLERVADECPAQATFYFYPTEATWKDGDREVSCVLESLFDLKVGDCVNYLGQEDLFQDIQRVNCTDPHDAEVIDAFEMGQAVFPGMDGADEYASENCPAATDLWLVPTEDSWAAGDRAVTCLDE